jgi:hypothetical protein
MLGRSDKAERHFENAITLNEKMGARPWTAHCRHDLAQLLLTRGRSSDYQRSSKLLSEAFTAAGEMGMAALTTKIERIPRQTTGHNHRT